MFVRELNVVRSVKRKITKRINEGERRSKKMKREEERK